MTAEQFRLYERRIDNCFKAADTCTDPQFKQFWYQTAMALLRKVNRSLSSAGLEHQSSKLRVAGSNPAAIAKYGVNDDW